MDRLDEIRARCDAATPGPWDFAPAGTIYHDPLKLIAHALGSGEDSVSNAAFIANAREDIPYLLEEVKQARAALRGEEITDCDKCDIWSEDGENCGWTHDGKDFVCVRGHILTAKEKQAALRKSSELRKHDEAAPGKEQEK